MMTESVNFIQRNRGLFQHNRPKADKTREVLVLHHCIEMIV
jgi:hypothetical protein